MIRPLLQSSRRFFRRHPGQFLLALAGMAAGVAVITGVALIRDVLVDSLDEAAVALAGRDSVRITATAGPLDESLFTELALAPGAPALLPVLSQRVRHDGRRIALLGVDPFSAADGPGSLAPGVLAALLREPEAVAANATTLQGLGVRPGEHLQLEAGNRSLDVRVVASLSAGHGLDDRLLMDIAALQDLLGRQGELSWIDAPAGARDWLQERLPKGVVLTDAASRRDSAARLTEGMRANLTAMGLISLVVGLFVIYSVLSFLLVQRRRTLAMLRAVGATVGQVRAQLLLETAALAGFGALLGLVLGTIMAEQLLGLVRAPLAEIYDLLAPARVQPAASLYAAVWLLAMALALLSTWGLLREAGRIPPGQLLRSGPDQTGGRFSGLALALLVAAGGLIGLSSGLPAAFVALFMGLGGFALLSPGLGLLTLEGLRRVAPASPPARALALLLAGRRRIRPALAALSLALALAAGLAMMVLGFRAAVGDWIERLLRADSYVTAGSAALTPELVERIGRLPGIVEISSARRVRLDHGRQLIAYDLPDRAWAGFEWLAGEPRAAREAFRAGSGVIVSEPLARREGLTLGDRVELDPPLEGLGRPVVGIYRDYASDRGSIAVHAPLYRVLSGDRLRDSIGLYYGEATPRHTELAALLADLDEDLQLTGRAQVRDGTLAVFDRTFRISWALAALVGIIAVIALVSALLALGLERRRDYALLRALGLTPRGLHWLVICQTAGLALAAAIVALPMATAIHLGLSLVVQPRAFGWSLPLSWPVAPLVLLLPLALVCGFMAGLYPAWRIGRRQPARELRGE